MSDHARRILPALIDWLYEDARIAVQVFLVIGGFLAAMLVAVAASALAGSWTRHDAISAPPTLFQLAAHALLLHDVLGIEALSAGAWHVAIDLQLYALPTLLAWLSGCLARISPLPWLLPGLVAAGVAASLLHFKRDADRDVWAPYFFGSDGLGALTSRSAWS